MTRLLMPLLLVGVALGLFMLYTNPTYQSIKLLRAQVAEYDDALNKSKELRTIRDELNARRNTFAPEAVQKLERILPDNVDNIRFAIEIDNIATRRNLSIGALKLGEVSDSRAQKSPLAVGASGDAVGSVDVGFEIEARYEDFLTFLQDLEHSLRLIDIEKISFKATEGGNIKHAFTIRTYWLH